MNNFNVVTVPSFSDFVEEMPDTPNRIARIVLGEKTRQRSGVPIVDVTLDLQGFNDCHELVWLSKSVTIVGLRRNGTFDNSKKQAHYEAMDDLKHIIVEQLEALGFQVRAGRYVLPDDHLPINGIFDCAEWSWNEKGYLQVVAASDW